MPEQIQRIIAEQAVQGEKIQSIQDSCKEIKYCLLGNGKPGLIVRTDRLEQKDATKTKLFWVVVAAVTALAVKTIGIDLIGAIARVTGQ